MIGSRIRELRKRRNMTLRELAAELEIPFTTLGNYERGDRQPDIDLLISIAKFFGVTMDYLTRDDNILDLEEYNAIQYMGDWDKLLRQVNPEVRGQLIHILDELFFITIDQAIANGHHNNPKELILLEQILNFIHRMKFNFGKGANIGFSESMKYEVIKSYLTEKQEFDKSINTLFNSYLEGK